jgi:signal transduction histidine kinase
VARELKALLPNRLDAILGLAVAALGLGEALTSYSGVAFQFVAASTLGPLVLAWRRKAPGIVVIMAAAGLLLVTELNAQETTLAAWLTMLVAMASLGLEAPFRVSLPVIALGAVVLLGGSFLIGGRHQVELLDVGFVSAGYGGAFAAGAVIRVRSQRARLAELRAVQLEEEQERQAQAAAEAERSRIARELHDIVSHSISVIAVQTQAVRRRLQPEQEREVSDLRAVETVARQALAEMRRMLGVLRANGSEAQLQPQPGLAQLGRLIERMREAGLVVELRVEGRAVPLPPGVDLAAYRVIQESLTNVLRHAKGANVQVSLEYTDSTLQISVQDDGPRVSPSRQRSGQGLVGLRERILLYGGTFNAGPRENGRGFRVVAGLPVREGAVSD